MIYHFTLQQVAIALGICSILGHGIALAKPQLCRQWWLAMPRNYPLGITLMVVDCLWFCWLLLTADLMDFASYQNVFLIISIALAAGMIFFVREFLAVRALGAFLLLLSNVLLDAAFLHNHPSKLVITVVAYVYIICGIVFVASPYLLRDLLDWFYRNPTRSKLGTWTGLAFGILLLGLGLLVY